jgi:D-alanyl-D-alanine carboxypeptidase
MKKSHKIKFLLFFSLAVMTFGGLFSGNIIGRQTEAEEVGGKKNFSIFLDKPTIEKGYTVNAFNNGLKLSLTPGILNGSTYVAAQHIDEEMETPWNLNRISKIYQFEFLNKQAYNHKAPFYIQFSYDEDSNNYKKVYFYDSNLNKWRPLPTQDFPERNFVRSLIHLPFARIAVFSSPEILSHGKASWYQYKGGLYAASPDFPKGSKIRVFNTLNNKYVDVEINDYGPDRSIHPDRVIDLDKRAFDSIADLGAGIINVKVQPLSVPESDNVDREALMETPMGHEPEADVWAGVIMNENSGDIIWGRDVNDKLPLASLTKMVAIKVFLENETGGLDREVIYKREDEEKNHAYCEPWESAKVNLKDGDILTIRDLIHSSLVGSANNAVETLVRVSDLNRNEFVRKMNETVASWGAKRTHFVEPTGLSPQNVSTVYDYALIAKEVLVNDVIMRASTMPSYEFTTVNTERSFDFKNTDNLVSDKHFSGINHFRITGSKTGYLHEAGYCLMVRVDPEQEDAFVVVTFGADSRSDSFEETRKLIKYGLRKMRQ